MAGTAGPPVAVEESSSTHEGWTWGVGMTTLAAGLAGGALLIVAMVQDDALEEDLAAQSNGATTGVSQVDARARDEENGRLETTGFVLLGVAAVGAVVTTILLATGPGGPEEQPYVADGWTGGVAPIEGGGLVTLGVSF